MTDTYTAPFMLRTFKTMCGILPWLLAVLSIWCQSLSYPHRPRGLSVRVQCPSLLLWKGSGCVAIYLTWLAYISIRWTVMVLPCHTAGNSNGRDCASPWVRVLQPRHRCLSPSPLTAVCQQLCPLAHQCSLGYCGDPGSWVWKGKWHELYVYTVPTGLT